MAKLATLYKQDNKTTQVWEVETGGAQIITRHGKKGGKMVETVTLAKPKNVGKANATTSEEQAEKQALAKWTKKVERSDYAIRPEWSNKQLRPMLALDATKVGHRIRWDSVVAQPKLDGLRLLYGDRHPDKAIGRPELLSRQGEKYNIPAFLVPAYDLYRAVQFVMDERGLKQPLLALDGEAYHHGTPLNEIVHMVRSGGNSEEAGLRYAVFDLVINGVPFSERYYILLQAFHAVRREYRARLSVVRTQPVNENSFGLFHGRSMEAGYEGTIIRHTDGLYKKGRSADLFKYKEFKDEEVLITGVGIDELGRAKFEVRRDNGVELNVAPKRTDAQKRAILENPEDYIGKLLTVKYQTETPYGSLQFPIGLAVRDYE